MEIKDTTMFSKLHVLNRIIKALDDENMKHGKTIIAENIRHTNRLATEAIRHTNAIRDLKDKLIRYKVNFPNSMKLKGGH